MEKQYDIKTKEELILDYKPSEPLRTVSTNYKEGYLEDDASYSQSVSYIDSLKPSYMVNGLSILKDNILSTIDMLNNLIGYEVEEVSDQYINDINGDTKLEMLKAARDVLKECNDIKEAFVKINYKEDLKEEAFIDYDEELVNNIKSLEASGKESGINYYSLYIDCQVNKLLNMYIDSMTNYTVGINNLVYKESETLDKEYKDILLKLYEENLKISIYDRDKLQSVYKDSIVTNTLNSIYAKKEETISLIDKVSSLKDVSIKSDLEKLVSSHINDLTDLITEFNKALRLSSLYKIDYLNTLSKRKNIKDMYQKL